MVDCFERVGGNLTRYYPLITAIVQRDVVGALLFSSGYENHSLEPEPSPAVIALVTLTHLASPLLSL